jgi:hypothetical protein
MKSKIGVAAFLGLLLVGFGVAPAAAQCTGTYPGPMIKFDADCFAYETNYAPATFTSAAGSQLTVVGLVSLFCSPFADLNPADPNTEYSFVWDNLLSLGTTSKPFGISGTQYTTKYVGGAFRIYAGSPRNAPTALTLPALPSPLVPANFMDGTILLQGTLDTLTTIVTRNSTGTYGGSFRTTYLFTGGTLFYRVGNGTDLLSGAWCAAGSGVGLCSLPAGWSAHPNGKWDMPITTPALPSTWGALKQLYR